MEYLNLSITDPDKVWNHYIVNVAIDKNKRYVFVSAHVK